MKQRKTKDKTSKSESKDPRNIRAKAGKLINARVTVEMREKIRERANVYAHGNMSAFMIWAAMHWTPTRAQLTAMQSC